MKIKVTFSWPCHHLEKKKKIQKSEHNKNWYLTLLAVFLTVNSKHSLHSPSVKLTFRYTDTSIKGALQACVLEDVNTEQMLKSVICSEKENKGVGPDIQFCSFKSLTHCSGVILLLL